MQNLAEPDFRRAAGVLCPGVLFPYARAVVSQLVSLGGFPQLLLPPVNFEALFAASSAERSTIWARAVLIISTPRFIRANCSEPIRPCVSLVNATQIWMTSAVATSSSNSSSERVGSRDVRLQ